MGFLQEIETIDLDRLHKEDRARKRTLPDLQIWPKPDIPGKKRGPNPKQVIPWKWGHQHPKTIDVYLGAARSGKTIAVVAKCLWTAKKYPGARIVVGSMDFEHLKTTIIEDFKALLSIKDDWDHPILKKGKKLSREHKDLEFINGAIIRFVNLKLFIKTLGMKADLMVIEEAPTLTDEDMLDTLLGRLSSMKVPWKQVILTGNPLRSLGWMVKRFNLDQLDPSYEGAVKPIGKPCSCQYCLQCLKYKRGKFERVNGICPMCGYKNKSNCPGNQYFQRVVQFYPTDNDHVPDTLDADNEASMDANAYARMGGGHIIIAKTGVCYPHFTPRNVLGDDKPLDPKKDLIWALDFNKFPQCSVICQEYEGTHPKSGKPSTEILAVDEIVEWKATVRKVARLFVERFKPLNLEGKVIIHGDPAGYIGKVVNEDDKEEEKEYDYYHILVEALEKAKFTVECRVPKTRYIVSDRITNVNYMFEDGDEYRRLKVNPKCAHLIASASEVAWDLTGKKEDESIDKKAKRSGDWKKVHPMTHPMAALGYYLIQAHPLFPTSHPLPFIQDVSTGQVTALGKSGVEKYFASKSEDYSDLDVDTEDLEEITDNDYKSQVNTGSSALFRISELKGL